MTTRSATISLPWQLLVVLLTCSSNFGCDAFSINLSPGTSLHTSPTTLRATWSNGQAVKEYMDFLDSGEPELSVERDDVSVIVSSPNSPSSPVVEALFKLGNENDLLLHPSTSETLPPGLASKASYPIYIALPPAELESFLQDLPEDWKLRRNDFIFLSGGVCGVIEPILKRQGMARDEMSQLLMGGFTLPGGSMFPLDVSCKIGVDAKGEDKWAGESAACGKWRGAVEERLERAGIRCRTGFYREWRRMMWERGCFDAIFNLIGAIRAEPTTVQEVGLYYDEEVSDMLWEATSALRGMLAVTLLYGFEERLFGFSEQLCNAVPSKITAEMYPYVFVAPLDQCKTVAEYLNFAKDERGMLEGVKMPLCSTKKSAMLQGNLRCDGKI